MSDEILFYSFIYLSTGFVVIFCILARACFNKKLEHGAIGSIKKDYFLYILWIIIWPFVIIILLYFDNEAWKKRRTEKAQNFELKITDLVDKVDKCEVENREVVYDPLYAVPSVPFGHLNSAWVKFCEQIEPQDELWTFNVIWPSPWGSKERYSGYAAVRNNKIAMIFYTN